MSEIFTEDRVEGDELIRLWLDCCVIPPPPLPPHYFYPSFSFWVKKCILRYLGGLMEVMNDLWSIWKTSWRVL